MDRIIVFDHNEKNIGLFKRSSIQGREFDLVKEFIKYYVDVFFRYNKVNNLAIFIEPKLISGAPDIVFASFSPLIKENWSDYRKMLKTTDLKIYSQLIRNKGILVNEVENLKFSKTDISRAINKLIDAKMITNENGYLKPVIERTFYIRELVSVEAKIANINRVIEQTFCNTWFASKSYALIESKKPSEITKNMFEKFGLGLYCKKGRFKKVVEAKRISLPSSYQSLQFNEWIGNKIALS